MSKESTLANPAPVGLMGFGMTTVLLNIHNAGIYPLDTMILAVGIFYGGIAQFIAGIMEFRKGNTFGMTAFMSFGSFWLTLVFLLVLPRMGWWEVGQSSVSFSLYLFMWGLFTLGMFIGTLKLSRALQTIFGSLVILFWLLAFHHITGSRSVGIIAGWEGIFCGLSAIYTSIAEVLNEVYGKVILPVGR
ncbi:MAG: acetate uptake transporter [Deltaproteobacteria bacterium]|nr:acetate uptake transporter [Deltaproteobacteria bacterium]